MTTRELFFSAARNRDFETAARRHFRAGWEAIPTTGVVLGASVLLAGVVGVEYALALEVFTAAFGPDLPGETARWSPQLFALSGTVALLGYHVHAARKPDALFVRVIERAANVCVALWPLGFGVAVASLAYFEGVGTLVTQTAEASRDLFADAPGPQGWPVLDRLMASSSVLFALSLGGIATINLTLGSALIKCVRDGVKSAFAAFHAAREARAAIGVIRASQRRLFALTQARDALLADGEGDRAAATAHDIAATINAALAPWDRSRIDAALRGGAPDSAFAMPVTNIDPQEIGKRVSALRAITAKTILTILRKQKD